MRRVHFSRDPRPDEVGSSAEQFLHWMGGPACLLLTGRDDSRTRALVTLLHGNEPSGTIALHRWLRSGERPAVNVVCVVASVAAALEEPLFSHRMLPRARDLNRCFRPPFDDAQGALAEELLTILRLHRPEAVVDIHNTSGSGPAFGVCRYTDRNHEALVALFTRRMVVSDLDLGSLMELTEAHCPTVTVEVGGRLDAEAHELAYEGLCRYFRGDDVLQPERSDWDLEQFAHPIRLELQEHVTLTYAETPSENYDITLRPDIEHHNFGGVRTDTQLGWANAAAERLFRAQDGGGRCAVAKLVRIEGGRLYPAQNLKLFMITTNAQIAHADCLFYAVGDDGSTILV